MEQIMGDQNVRKDVSINKSTFVNLGEMY